MFFDFFSLTLNSLIRRKLRSWLTMIGIFIGIAAVVSLIGLGEGLRKTISSQFGFLGTDVLTIQASGLNFAGPPGTGSIDPLSDELVKKIEYVKGVDFAINRYIKSGSLEFNNIRAIGFAMNMPEGQNRKPVEYMMNLEVQEGRLLKDGDTRKVILGNSFSNSDSFNGGIKLGDVILLSDFKYEVVGILKSKGSFIFDNAVIVNENQLLKDFGDDGTTNIIAVKVNNINEIDNVKKNIEKLLRKERNVKLGDEDFTVQSPQSTIETLESSLFAVNLFVYIIAGISLLVGGIGIMNTMYTAVIERTKEIGIMKSIGAKNHVIFTLFSLESGLLGSVGGLIGIFLGLGIAHGLVAIAKLSGIDIIQVEAGPLLIFGSLIFSFVIGFFAGVLPAMRASKMNPVDALRFVK